MSRAVLAVVCSLCWCTFAQNTTRLSNSHERIWCVVPLIGKGTLADPRRPMFAPTPTEIAASNRTGIIAYSFQASDDGQFALVQFVARNKSAFAAISNQLNSSIQTFLPNRDSRGAIQSEFAKRKKNFDLKSLEVLVP